MLTQALINDFATRCFRDVADLDYIHARLAYRARLFPQFHWSALQAVEKYFKAILLYNRVVARGLGHDLAKAIEYTKKLPFDLKLSDSTAKLIEYLDTYGRFRYLESSYFIHGPKLVELDKAAWEIRRYCRVINYEMERDGERINFLDYELAAIEKSEQGRPQEFRVSGGELETIVDSVEHPSRHALIWQNGFFGRSKRKAVRMHMHLQATNAPLALNPELLDEVIKYVYLPKDVERAYREELVTRSKQCE